MKTLRGRLPELLLSALVPVALVACGDDVTNNTNVTGARMVADLAAAGTCDAAATGEIVLNSEDLIIYVCDGAQWISMKGDPGEQGAPGDSGAPGEQGVPGAPGAPGDGCVFEALKDKQDVARAVVVTCGEQVDTLVSAGYALCGGVPFDVSSQLCDARDNSLYNIVRIGSQIWMAENLNFEYKINGSAYDNWCYNDSAQYCAQYGRLYYWSAAMDTATTGCGIGKTCAASSRKTQGVCPNGWHLPDSTEWEKLFDAVGGKDSAAAMLKSTDGWEDHNGTDAYGFAALPAGYITPFGESVEAGSGRVLFWSSSVYDQNNGYRIVLRGNQTIIDMNGKNAGFAVRCVKD